MRRVEITLVVSLLTLTSSFTTLPEPHNCSVSSLQDCWNTELYHKVEDASGEYGEYFQGDMILSEEQIAALNSRTRNGRIGKEYRWPENTVPYQLTLSHSRMQRKFIKESLKVIESISCIRFVERTTESDYIEITAQDRGCFSAVGRQRGRQVINFAPSPIGRKCFRLGTIIYEFLHALGFYHMQSSFNRDDHVTIIWENVMNHGKNQNFMKQIHGTNFNSKYDYESVLHYDKNAFSINGQPTIIPKDPKYLEIIGQRRNISDGDIFRLNAIYECNKDSKL